MTKTWYIKTHYNSSVSIKVQIASATSPSVETSPGSTTEGKNRLLGLVLGSMFGIFCVAFVIGLTYFTYWKKNKSVTVEEDYLDHVPGMPTRFCYEELVTATDNFSKKLGEGGFGTVFEGSLKDNTRIAVKCLDGMGHIKKSFLAEVESIGSIHHVNLVRLIGFSAEKSHRLLVYVYMSNGSLDRWIHNRTQPQNKLQDENYNAKLADFGLAKLIDRDQSQVVTVMRGTPVDVYSFGVVILEILCARKIFDIFNRKAMEGQLLDLVDKCCEDMQSNGTRVVEMMQIAAWCLQSDYVNRYSMSMVVKVIEGAKHVAKDLDYNFTNPQYCLNNNVQLVGSEDVTPLLPSVLSGPR
ncbi:hypothetical protein ACJIZ3_019828 [Penstemon smallii]|uniref:Protein kinase domain-containing protein n=1 Tax=Penstemon smallii TaxID=265156 RepID=A0ABD3T351_9LAMI